MGTLIFKERSIWFVLVVNGALLRVDLSKSFFAVSSTRQKLSIRLWQAKGKITSPSDPFLIIRQALQGFSMWLRKWQVAM
jgi:hypothetical protein